MRASRLPLVIVAIAGLATISGCLQPDPAAVSEGEAERIAVTGMRALAVALAGGEDGNLRAFDMHVAAPDANPGDNGTTMSTLDVRMEWGPSGDSVRHVLFDDGRQQHETHIWCSNHDVRYQWEGDVYQERRITDPARTDPCTFARVHEAADLLAPFTPDGADSLPVPEVYVDNGEVTAVFHYGQGESLTVQHDPQGLVRTVNGQGSDGHFEAVAEYGPRRALIAPDATERIPAHIDTAIRHDAQTGLDLYEVVSSWHSPALDDIEARWVARDPLDSEPVVLLRFPLDADDEPGPEGQRFQFHDNDGDGRVTIGDHYTFEAPEMLDAPESLVMHELVLYDLWADEEVNAPVPAVALPLVVLASLGAAGLLRRRCQS